jgi:hypothetical protein
MTTKPHWLFSCALFFATLACAQSAAKSGTPVFTDVTDQTGITFVQTSSPEKKYIVESMSGGVALFDYDNDGWLDIYFVNSCNVSNYTDPKCGRSALYHNDHNMKFTDVTEKSGLAYPGWGMGVCAADIDGDGFADLYVTGMGGNKLYRNRGDGTFEDITKKAGVEGGGWSTGCGFADFDHDGDLDLFVSRYVKLDLKDLPEFGKGKSCQFRGVPVQCGPRGLPGMTDLFYRNNGDGTFTEVSKEVGVDDPQGYFGLGVAWFDYNGDGWIDLFVADDASPNLLYKNLGNGKFAEVGFPAGVALSEDGSEQGSMGVALADYNGDGRLDLFITNFSEEYNALYRAEKDTNFTDASFASKTAPSSLPYVGWGTAFFDYDNDGWPDILVVNGHVYPQLEDVKMGGSAGYKQRKLLYHNLGNGTFEEVSAQAGSALMQKRSSRGAAFGDLDNDGDIDVVVNDLDSKPMILRNDAQRSNHWIGIKLLGIGKNKNAIGSQVKLVSAGHTQVQVVRSGSSYISQDDFRLHFGLGSAAKIDDIEITWPDGSKSHASADKLDAVITITQPTASK